MGVAVFAGMIGVTLFGIFLTPVFYVLLRQLSGNRPFKVHGTHAAPLAAELPAPAPRAEATRAVGDDGDR
jgi:multidrug efflux pump